MAARNGFIIRDAKVVSLANYRYAAEDEARRIAPHSATFMGYEVNRNETIPRAMSDTAAIRTGA